MVPPLKRVLRVATEADHARVAENEALAESSLLLCRERVVARGMPMKLLRAEYAFDRSQITVYFSAEGRVDFRELVKDLAAVLRTRIQLHQVGARDAAKLMGGIGPCGRALCCATWLTDVPADLHADGEGAEPLPESDEVQRGLRQADVLSPVPVPITTGRRRRRCRSWAATWTRRTAGAG